MHWIVGLLLAETPPPAEGQELVERYLGTGGGVLGAITAIAWAGEKFGIWDRLRRRPSDEETGTVGKLAERLAAASELLARAMAHIERMDADLRDARERLARLEGAHIGGPS